MYSDKTMQIKILFLASHGLKKDYMNKNIYRCQKDGQALRSA